MATPSKGPKMQVVEIDTFLGLNTLDSPRSLNPSYSPYMVNMDITSTGKVQSRFGYEPFATIPAVTGGLSGLLPYYRTAYDNTSVDQSQDPTAAYANTYAVPVAVSETATNKCSFTPTKSGILKIAVYIVAKGTGEWTLWLHDAANVNLNVAVISNANLTNGAFNYFNVPYTWTSGTLHFHVTSTVNDGTLKSNVANDLATASFIETYDNRGDYLLTFFKGTAYSLTNANTTPASIGAFAATPYLGTDYGQVRGVVHNNFAIFNDGHPGNQGKTWDATTLGNLASGSIWPQYFGKWNNRLWATGPASPSTTNYSDTATTDTNLTSNFINLSINDGTTITALVDAIDKLHVLKENSIQGVTFNDDPSSSNITIPKETPIISPQGGAYAPGSAVTVYNYIYFLSKTGFQNYGNLLQGVQANQPLPMSQIIDNTIAQINYLFKNEVSATYYQQRYLCAVPLGASTINNTILVYSEAVKKRYQVDNWVAYTGIPIRQFAIFRDANKRDQLYFASALEPVIYKFNTSFSDNGFGYDRIWRSKTFQFGQRTHYYYVDIEGSKTINSTLYVDIVTDGQEVNNLQITDANFVSAAVGGGYIGENYLGDSYTGEGYYSSETVPLYRFRKRIRFPISVNEGYGMYFQIRNNANNEGWNMTKVRVTYSLNPEDPTDTFTD